MIQETLAWAADAMGGDLINTSASKSFRGVCTDTRMLKAQELFFCLVGNRNGHDFAHQASQMDVGAIIIDQDHKELAGSLPKSTPIIVVTDTLQALGDLAQAWRRKFSIPVVALTGSNGKTTTKELIRTVLSTRYRVLATEGNFNNLIGVPKTLFGLESSTEIAVVEMGMNDFGEIARLTEITEPTVALITNIAPAHLEKLKSIDGVAKAKGELFANLTKDATAIYNQKDSRIAQLNTQAKKIEIGTPNNKLWGKVSDQENQNNSLLSLEIYFNDQTYRLELPIPGEHNLDNVLLTLAVANIFKIDIKQACQALENFTSAPSRMEIVELINGKQLIDDSYNANPASTIAAINTLAKLKGTQPGLAILGDMNELGDFTKEGHRQVGENVAKVGIDYLITIGRFSEETLAGAKEQGLQNNKFRAFPDVNIACEHFNEFPNEVSWVLIKGSRTNHLEKLVSLFKEQR